MTSCERHVTQQWANNLIGNGSLKVKSTHLVVWEALLVVRVQPQALPDLPEKAVGRGGEGMEE